MDVTEYTDNFDWLLYLIYDYGSYYPLPADVIFQNIQVNLLHLTQLQQKFCS